MRKTQWIALQILAGTFLTCLGCSQSKLATDASIKNGAATDTPGTSLLDTHWRLLSLMGRSVADSGKTKEIYVLLKSSDHRVEGNGGCNAFAGTFSMKNKFSLAFGQMISTKMWCEGIETETEFFSVLSQVDNFTIRADTLSLNKARMAPLARFVAVKQG